MLIFLYPSKKVLKENIGKPLKYRETSIFGIEYSPNARLVGSNRPSITGICTYTATGKRKLAGEFFAEVIMKNGLIEMVN